MIETKDPEDAIFPRSSSREDHASLPNEHANILQARAVPGTSEVSLGNDQKDSSGSIDGDDWQDMPVFASHDIYDDDGKIIALEEAVSTDDEEENQRRGGAGKGYTRVTVDENDAENAMTMDDETKFLFNDDDPTDLDARNPLFQMQSTKDMLTETQRIAYVGLCKLCIVDMATELAMKRGSIKSAKNLSIAHASMAIWNQKMMIRLYSHMDISLEGIVLN